MMRNEPYSRYPQEHRCTHHVLQWGTRERCNQKPLTSCRAYRIMRMMCCVGGQNNGSQMIFLLHDSIWSQSIDSNPSTSCRRFGIMCVNECVVEHKTVQRWNRLYDIIHCSFILFVLLSCALFYSSNPDCFETMDRLIWRPSSCFAYEIKAKGDACLRTGM